MTAYEVIAANTLDSDYALSATPPKFKDRESILGLIGQWRRKDGVGWPKDITAGLLIGQLQLIYIAHWRISGYGWVDWSGEEHRKRGKYGYDVITHSGVATETLENYVAPDFDPASGLSELKCGSRDETTQSAPLNSAQAASFPVLTVKGGEMPEAIIRAHLNKILRKKGQASAMALNAMWGLEITPARVERIQATQWLYPFYLGHYEYGGETLGVQIDAVTGVVHVDPPKKMRQARMENILIAVLGTVAVIVVLAVILRLVLKI